MHTSLSVKNITSRLSFFSALLISGLLLLSSCSDNDGSTKAERNAIKSGNRAYHEKDFKKAVEDYSEALESNPSSEKAKLNLAMATWLYEGADTTARKQTGESLIELAKNAKDPEVSENALYTLSNIHVYIGDELKRQAEAGGEPGDAQELNNKATENYRAAISGYEELLRRKPGDLKVTQNLRITQLKLPPEQDQDQNKDQEQQQDQQQQDQQQQQQQQQQQPQADALNALDKREAKTRQNMVPVSNSSQTDKPW